mgnify:CR=1 FL=1
MSDLEALPEELLLCIFRTCGPGALCICASSCRTLSQSSAICAAELWTPLLASLLFSLGSEELVGQEDAKQAYLAIHNRTANNQHDITSALEKLSQLKMESEDIGLVSELAEDEMLAALDASSLDMEREMEDLSADMAEVRMSHMTEKRNAQFGKGMAVLTYGKK